MKYWILLFSWVVSHVRMCGNAYALEPVVSPVVQVISYRDIYGNSVEMLGRGSASIIDKHGTILTNNHVIDDGAGQPSSAFSVCVTTDLSRKPECHYTASLIARDADKDLALLRIDPLDINGNPVSYHEFPVLQIDYTYTPKIEDQISAVGYPWIGAETMSQTKGTVAGSIQYNDLTYIKTDTIIAGGNSGGPLIHDGKIVGVTTFTIGNMFDPSLGYGVLVADVQEFIEGSRIKIVSGSPQKYNLAGYRKQLDTINQERLLVDKVFQIRLDPAYEVKNYQAQTMIDIVPRDNKRTHIDGLEVFVIPTPTLKTQSEFVYFIQGLGVFDKQSQKLTTTTIGGLTMYQPVYLQDASQGDILDERYYIGQLNSQVVVMVVARAAFSDEIYGDQREQDLYTLLSGFDFSVGRSYVPARSFVLKHPLFAMSGIPTMSPLSRWGRALISLGSLHEYIAVNVYPLDSWEPDQINERFNSQTQGVQEDQKSLITVQGKPGYIVCSDSTSLPSSFDFGDDGTSVGGWTVLDTDVQGRVLTQGRCRVVIVLDSSGKEHDWTISFELIANVSNLSKHLNTLITLMTNKLGFASGGMTQIPNLLKQRVKLLYRDIDQQSEEWKSILRILVKYQLLQNDDSLDPTDVMTQGSFIRLLLRWRYAKSLDDPDVQSALQGIRIRRDEPVLSDQVWGLIELVHLRLAGVRLADESLMGLQVRSQTKTNPSQKAILEKLQAFEQSVYGPRKIGLGEVVSSERGWYQPLQIALGVPGKGVVLTPVYAAGAIDFGMDETRADAIRFAGCVRSSRDLLKAQCLQVVKDVVTKTLSYRVLTKGEAIDLLVDEIDFALFDPSLALKKEVTIE